MKSQKSQERDYHTTNTGYYITLEKDKVEMITDVIIPDHYDNEVEGEYVMAFTPDEAMELARWLEHYAKKAKKSMNEKSNLCVSCGKEEYNGCPMKRCIDCLSCDDCTYEDKLKMCLEPEKYLPEYFETEKQGNQ